MVPCDAYAIFFHHLFYVLTRKRLSVCEWPLPPTLDVSGNSGSHLRLWKFVQIPKRKATKKGKVSSSPDVCFWVGFKFRFVQFVSFSFPEYLEWYGGGCCAHSTEGVFSRKNSAPDEGPWMHLQNSLRPEGRGDMGDMVQWKLAVFKR